jgi:ribosome-associated protein
VNSKAELWIDPNAIRGLSLSAIERLRKLAGRRLTGRGEIHLSSDTERGQEANRAEVMARLREMIVTAKVEPKVRKKTRPSRGARARRLEGKKRRSEIKSRRRGGFGRDE